MIDERGPQIGNGVRRIDHALEPERVDAALVPGRLPALQPRPLNDEMRERDELTAVDHSVHDVEAHRAIAVVLNVVLAAPRHFHRHTGGARYLGGFLHVVRLEAPAESAAQERRVNRATFQRQSAASGRRQLSPLLHLRRRPHLARAVVNVGGRVHGFHRRVRQKRSLIRCLEDGSARRGRIAARQCNVFAAVREREMSGLSKQLRARELRVRTLVPGDRQGVAALKCGPRILRDHGDAVRDPDHVVHARYGTCLAVVDVFDASAEDRRARDRCVHHPRQPDIDPILCRTVDLRRNIGSRPRLADQRETAGRFERNILRHGELRGSRCERTVRSGAVRSGMIHDAVSRRALRTVDVPLVGRGGDEHGPRGGTGMPQREPRAVDRRTPARRLFAELRVDVGGVRRCELGGDAPRIGVELIGENRRQTVNDALAHFRFAQQNGDRLIGRDCEPTHSEQVRCSGRMPASATRGSVPPRARDPCG